LEDKSKKSKKRKKMRKFEEEEGLRKKSEAIKEARRHND
jgi:hypothetical protein